MKTKVRRYHFFFSQEIADIIEKLAVQKDWKYSKVVEKALKLLDEKEK